MHLVLSDQQRAFVRASGNQFTEACPGAGKTRAIVTRFLRRAAEEPRKGIGLLSFTTAAVDEVTVRCAGNAEALRAPHFVGTFDKFINRFITRPWYTQEYGLPPRFTDTWTDIRLSSFRLYDMGSVPNIELGWFEFDGLLRATLQEQWLPRKYRNLLAPLVAERRRELETRASAHCRSLVAKGLLCAASSRALAARYLTQVGRREQIGRLLAARFSEVIVDEVQDCGPEELLVLDLLLEYGVAVVAVADIDQSIYEFRRAVPDEVRAFVSRLGPPRRFDGNYRSSPAICALNNSLRQGKQRETACGDNRDCLTPIQLLSFKRPEEVAPAVEALLTTHHLTRGDVIFVAHIGSDARSYAGALGSAPGNASNSVLGIAQASIVLRSDSSTGSERLRALRVVERTLRGLAAPTDEDEAVLDERWLRDTAVRLALSLNPAGLGRL